jgi:hypothetical protein
MTALDEIRLFFDSLRKPPPRWLDNLFAIDPAVNAELRSESEHHWRLAMECLDMVESSVVDIASGDHPVEIELSDRIIAIIRRRSESEDERFREIGKLLLAAGKTGRGSS